MARVYINCKINYPDSGTLNTPVIDFITFAGKEGKYDISPNWASDWCIENGEFSARWKGVDISSASFEPRELSLEDLAKFVKPVSMQMYFAKEPRNAVEIADLKIEIEVGKTTAVFLTPSIHIEIEADSTEGFAESGAM